MGIGRRIAQIFRSRRDGGEDVEALADQLDETYRSQLSHLQKVRRGVADVATSRKRVEVQLARLAQEAATLDTEAQAAVARNDDDAARASLTRKVTLEQAADDLRERHGALQSEEQKLISTADDLEQRIEDFRRRKDTLTARHSAAAARAEITGAGSGIASSMSDVNQAMESAERHTRELEAKADAVDELVEGGIISTAGGERRRRRAASLRCRAGRLHDWKEGEMARSRFRSDRGLSLRMGGVGLGLGALYVAFGAVLIFYSGSAIFGLVITVAMAWGQWYFSDRLALKSIGGREVTPEQAPELHAMIDRLCVLADMPKPRVAVAVTDMPNAFATGRTPSHSVVCVTTGIMQRLDADELEGVLSHELAHVANRDVSVMTVASSLGLLAGFITRWGMYIGGGRNRNGGGVPFLVVFLVSMVVYFVSFLLTRALSRYRELSADRSGAYLTGRPSKLASALVKISGEMSRIPNRDLRDAQALSAFFIAPAINRESIGAMMSTHPPLQQRLDQLARVGAELAEP